LARCSEVLQEQLLASYSGAKNPENGFLPSHSSTPVHQQGRYRVRTLDAEHDRFVTVYGNALFQEIELAFYCPSCFVANADKNIMCQSDEHRFAGNRSFEAREASDQEGTENIDSGYLYLSTTSRWPTEIAQILDRVPRGLD